MKYPVGMVSYTHYPGSLLNAKMGQIQVQINRLGGIDNSLGPILLDIIDQQSQRGALLITSQYPTTKWYDLFNDPTIADAILDRIVHQAHFLQLHGESMRKTKKRGA